jgi:predicted negative regulator of RcsB-dependent stress response
LEFTEDEQKEIQEAAKLRDEECQSKNNGRLLIFGGIVLLALALYIGWLFWRNKRLNRASFRIRKVSFRRGNRNRLDKALI